MTDENMVHCIFQIYQSQFIDTPTLESYLNIDLDSGEQSTFAATGKTSLNQQQNLFTSTGKQNCNISFEFNLLNKSNNQPLSIISDDIGNAYLKGKISSQDCKLEFQFDSWMSSPELLKAFLFTMLQIGLCSLGISPLYKMLKRNNMNQILILNEWAFLFNIMIDLVLTVINLTFSMKILVEYFEFLTVVTMFFMFSILFKFRFYLYANEIRQTNSNLDQRQQTRRKCFFMVKFVAFCVLAVACGSFLIQYEFVFYILFAYPLFQIFFNFSGVTRKNCFLWELHLPFVAAQLFYPIFMKGTGYSFFKLTPVKYFPVVLLTQVALLLLLLLLQKTFGACFFLPKCLIPNYFNYFKKFSAHPVEDNETCPICFSDLVENPDDLSPHEMEPNNFDFKELPMLPKTYMETPCKHRFHEVCLKSWMEHKLVCPCCRSNIPPVI